MAGKIFKEGGPHKIKKTGKDKYSLSIDLPKDKYGRLARECPSESCSPGYFKIKPGTGITENHIEAFCPYCRHSDDPNNFFTKEQIRYAEDLVTQEAQKGIDRIVEDSLGLGPSREKKLGGDFFSIKMSYKSSKLPYVRRPLEEFLRRDVICPHCGLDHSVFGLATWCADCGKNIFMTHVKTEFNVIKMMLNDSKRREKELGVRVAAKDIENALEDTVSIFEATLKILVKRYLVEKELPQDEIEKIFKKKIGNKFQNIAFVSDLTKELTSEDLFKGINKENIDTLEDIFQKRHPITHNLGIVDRKYLERVRSEEIEGRDVRVTVEEVNQSISISITCLNSFHNRLFKENT